MDKAYILSEIKRTTQENGGKPPGRERFLRETGIKQTDWIGKHWVRWGDALKEAGYDTNQLQAAYPDELLLESFIALTREIGKFPVNAELRMKARTDKTFPSHGTFARFGPKHKLRQRIVEFCQDRPGYEDIVRLCDLPIRLEQVGLR